MPNDLQPVRRIRPSCRSITGKFASQKTGRTHCFESTLERDYLTLLEFDPQVDVFVTQPVTITYNFEGKIRRYTPDVLVHHTERSNSKPSLVEIKYAAELEAKGTDLQPKFDAAGLYAQERNFTFNVITEKEIRTDRLLNLKFLSRYKTGCVDSEIKEQILYKLSQSKCLDARTLAMGNDLQINGNRLNTVWQLLSAKIICCDMQMKINMNTELWINNHTL